MEWGKEGKHSHPAVQTRYLGGLVNVTRKKGEGGMVQAYLFEGVVSTSGTEKREKRHEEVYFNGYK